MSIMLNLYFFVIQCSFLFFCPVVDMSSTVAHKNFPIFFFLIGEYEVTVNLWQAPNSTSFTCAFAAFFNRKSDRESNWVGLSLGLCWTFENDSRNAWGSIEPRLRNTGLNIQFPYTRKVRRLKIDQHINKLIFDLEFSNGFREIVTVDGSFKL